MSKLPFDGRTPFDLTDEELDTAMAEAGADAARRAHAKGIPVYESVDGGLRLWEPPAEVEVRKRA